MAEQFKVSQSKVSAWRRCKRQFHNQHVEHLKPNVKARPLKFGTMAHKMLEADYNKRDMFQVLNKIAEHDEKLFREEEEAYGRIVDDMGYIMRAYKKFWKDAPLKMVPRTKKKLLTEIPFEVEITPSIVCKGTFDGFVKARNGTWLLENKTHQDFGNADRRWRNLQSAVYIKITELLGWGQLEGVLWNYIRSKPPTRPKVLKDGTMSTVSIDTLPETVEDVRRAELKNGNANIEAGEGWEKVSKEAQNSLPSWFQRFYTPVNKSVVRNTFQEFLTTAREMRDYYAKYGNDTPPPRTIDLHCSWCAYEKLCRAEMQDNDIAYVRKTEYTIDATDYQTEGELA